MKINSNYYLLTVLMLLLFAGPSFSQKSPRFSLEAAFGLNANFFVRSYDEQSGPAGTRYFRKSLLGNASGISGRLHLGERSRIALGYTHTVNKREISYFGPFNSITLSINRFTIRHTDHFFELGYERTLFKKLRGLSADLGIFYVRSIQQEVELLNSVNNIVFDERKYANNGLEEGGIFAGIQYAFPIDTHFDLGIRTRMYLEVSTGIFESIILTPTLRYRF